jgi:tetratricopeptide (TPR) repeat protein
MSTKPRALIAAFLISTVALPGAATAQKPAAQAAASKLTVSKEAQPALAALQKAANENRVADIPGLAQAALAVAKTPVDRYFVYQLQLKPYVTAKNDPGLLTAIEGVIASGVPTGAELNNFLINAARMNYNANNDAKAAQFANQLIAADPNNADAYVIRGEINNRSKKYSEAVADLRKAAELERTAGKPVDPKLERRALAIAYNNRLPVAKDLALAQLKTSPTAENWRAAIKLADQLGNYQAADKVDLYRLQRATKSLEGEGDYFPYVDGLMSRGLPGEAKAVLEEAFASGKLDKSKALWRDLYNSAVTRNAADKGAANGDVYLSRGDYAKAAAAYRADAAKGGAGADAANLRLGIALAQSGDKAGAITALNSVKGQRASIAQMWLIHLGAQS